MEGIPLFRRKKVKVYLCTMLPPIEQDGYKIQMVADWPTTAKQLNLDTYSQTLILCDENTRAQCLPILLQGVDYLHHAMVLEIPSGEPYKNLDTCEKLWQTLFDLGVDRKALLINLGGGVVTDLGGFVAGAYKRGIDFVNIPTTLLAQVDASIGGKTGIDFGPIKNGVGLFNFPKAVWVHTPFLKTLDDAQLLSGFAEMLKHGLISSQQDWDAISTINPLQMTAWDTLIYRSQQIKANIVAQDPYEKGLRKVLNFGHTIGHALEGLALQQGKTLLHGHAVALGMVAELWLSAQKTGFPIHDVQKITTTLLNLYGPYDNIDQNTDGLAALLANDKKNAHGQLSFILLKAIGHPVMDVNCSMDDVRGALNYLEEQL